MTWRDDTELVFHPKVGFLLSHGALGDTITSLPALRYARESHNKIMELLVWTRRDLVPLLEILLPGCNVLPLEHFHEESARHDQKLPYPFAMNSSVRNTITRNKMDMVLFGYASLLDTQPPSPEWMSYPSAPLGVQTITEPYIVIAANGTAQNRILPAPTVAAVVEWALARGLRPVFLGRKESEVPVTVVTGNGPERRTKKAEATSKLEDIDPTLLAKCLDLREKTSIMEARDILGHAAAVVGIDGGLLHLAATTAVPIVYALTSVHPAHRSIVRDGALNKNLIHVTPRDLKCSGCQSKWTLAFGVPFTECVYEDYLCVSRLHHQDLIDGIKELIYAKR